MSRHATIDELLTAFAALSDSDLLALRKAAAILLGGTLFSEPADLMHEAVTRCLDGRRHWPVDTPFPLFLANAMKSIAGAERRLYVAKRVINASSAGADWPYGWLDSAGEPAPSAEEVCLERERQRTLEGYSRALTKAFESDHQARDVIAGWTRDLTASEIIEASGLTLKAYDAARKRVQRWAAARAAGSGRAH
jgi:hypothetical protein